VGIAYRARGPKEAPLVEVGQKVQAGDPVCLIEAMKMFNEVTAPTSGIVSAIDFENGALVEYGAPLVTITPATDTPGAAGTTNAAGTTSATPGANAAGSPSAASDTTTG
jgi:pyruvate/2-oxoglutarate dehydrogenase complex dihydrolipoamide acyltransferase (E2) component